MAFRAGCRCAPDSIHAFNNKSFNQLKFDGSRELILMDESNDCLTGFDKQNDFSYH